MTDGRDQAFEALYAAWINYLYTHEVGYPEDAKKPWFSKDDFRDKLREDGMCIKVCEGY